MQQFAQKLMSLRQIQTTDRTATAIFGTASSLSRSLDTRERVRIGLWPCVSAEQPVVAMGLFTILASLLERWQDIRVYRLFVALEDEPETFSWDITQSQFDVDDWQLDHLDENVAIWGQLQRQDEQWQLTIEVENDLDERVEKTLTYNADTVTALVNLLPKVAEDIAEEVESNRASLGAYEPTETDDDTVTTLLDTLFQWQVKLTLALWGQGWLPEDAIAEFEKLVTAGEHVGQSLGEWAITTSAAHTLLPGYGEIALVIADIAVDLPDRFNHSALPYMVISSGLFRLGQTQAAYELLEDGVEAFPDNALAWNLLAGLYRAGGQVANAVDAFQRAIENEAVSASLYQNYAEYISLIQDYNGDYIMIDPDDYDSELTQSWEAAEAFAAAYELAPEHIELLQSQLVLMADLVEENDEYDRLWAEFARLVKADDTGDAVRTVVDSFYALEDIDPAIDALESASEAAPDRTDLTINLAVAYLVAEDMEAAAEILEEARENIDDPDLIADIDRLLLSTDDPEFEARLGEISSIVDAGNSLSSRDVAFLEEALENAPMLAEAYVALGKSDLLDDDSASALEILLDGHKLIPDNPEIIGVLAQVLWDSGEHALAFDYLSKGIIANPNHVPLMTQIGLYLFQNEQYDAARQYLGRAQAISPRHPALQRAQVEIATLLNKDD